MTSSGQKQHRQDAILNAAEDLVRELHAISFSMLSLAKKAGIRTSPAAAKPVRLAHWRGLAQECLRSCPSRSDPKEPQETMCSPMKPQIQAAPDQSSDAPSVPLACF